MFLHGLEVTRYYSGSGGVRFFENTTKNINNLPAGSVYTSKDGGGFGTFQLAKGHYIPGGNLNNWRVLSGDTGWIPVNFRGLVHVYFRRTTHHVAIMVEIEEIPDQPIDENFTIREGWNPEFSEYVLRGMRRHLMDLRTADGAVEGDVTLVDDQMRIRATPTALLAGHAMLSANPGVWPEDGPVDIDQQDV